MHQSSAYIAAGNHKIHYLRVGTGSQLLLAFPGYGHPGSSMLPIVQYLGSRYTCILIDHPHHGGSQWPQKAVFTRAMLRSMCIELMKEYNVNSLSLLGYSMGGRVSLTIIDELGAQVDRATLIASDGLARNKYYTFFTRTALGRWLFSNMLHKPQPYEKVISWLKNKKWITEWQHKFVSYYIGDEPTRTRLSRVWPAMSHLMPSKRKVQQAIEQHNIPVHLFMGRYDKVIPAALGERFAAGTTHVHLHLLDKGHQIIGPDTAQQIAQTLL